MGYLLDGNRLVVADNKVEELDSIPNGVWLLKREFGKFCLIKQDDFSIPPKIYGNMENLTDTYLTLFKSMDKSMGVLFSGFKGSGKSLHAKLLSKRAKLPCILITEAFDDTEFKDFISAIKQEIMLFFDEFEKTYDTPEKQGTLLSLIDGIFNQKKLFCFTVNNASINSYLLNRPSRILFHKEYTGVSDVDAEEIIADLMSGSEFEEDMHHIVKTIGFISMDSLITLIQCVLTLKKPASEVLPMLNISVEDNNYSVIILDKGERFTTTFYGHPLKENNLIIHYKENAKDNQWWTPMRELDINLSKCDITFGDEGKVTIENFDAGYKVIFNRLKNYSMEIKNKFA